MSSEITTTTIKIRAPREHWLPVLTEALTQLDLPLDETERASAVQARRAGH
ncbi:hypothetical protein AB0K18_35635 [Nonomuraea sp. NPDC049421]|uniref:hypothetical protein n=1 Tax=Nonomuraea sp. NPDC049421 TaxID=3155275 RepID=UPI00341CF57F